MEDDPSEEEHDSRYFLSALKSRTESFLPEITGLLHSDGSSSLVDVVDETSDELEVLADKCFLSACRSSSADSLLVEIGLSGGHSSLDDDPSDEHDVDMTDGWNCCEGFDDGNKTLGMDFFAPSAELVLFTPGADRISLRASDGDTALRPPVAPAPGAELVVLLASPGLSEAEPPAAAAEP